MLILKSLQLPLTSTTERQLHEEQNIQTSIEEAVLNYARLTKKLV